MPSAIEIENTVSISPERVANICVVLQSRGWNTHLTIGNAVAVFTEEFESPNTGQNFLQTLFRLMGSGAGDDVRSAWKSGMAEAVYMSAGHASFEEANAAGCRCAEAVTNSDAKIMPAFSEDEARRYYEDCRAAENLFYNITGHALRECPPIFLQELPLAFLSVRQSTSLQSNRIRFELMEEHDIRSANAQLVTSKTIILPGRRIAPAPIDRNIIEFLIFSGDMYVSPAVREKWGLDEPREEGGGLAVAIGCVIGPDGEAKPLYFKGALAPVKRP